ncbi:MAG: hypothetical protein KatS3mg003_0959 [Candidatus Nitrosocaldaceae archaeon]|nr:MAG: hypothetical protein KatS3mg003_0959 [Candidatus Nitrosocaldaceae archaeon]
MNNEQIRSILSQLGMFLIKKSKELDEEEVKEWMSAWETRSSDGINVVLTILLTESEEDTKILKNKINEFAAVTKIDLALYNMEANSYNA